MNTAGPVVLIISSLAKSLVNFRADFIAELVAAGHRVVCAAPDMPAPTRERLLALGASVETFPMSRAGLDPRADLRTLKALRRIVRERDIDLVFAYNIKPVIYGAMAANSLGVSMVALITGLGFTFSNASPKARLLQPLTSALYRQALRDKASVIFQNPDDQRLFAARRIVTAAQPQCLVGGSGINLDRYPAKTGYSAPPRLRFLMLTRLIEEKGVRLYVEAARSLASRYPDAEFHLVGRPERTPSAIDPDWLVREHERGTVVYHGPADSAHDALTRCDVFVLPSYYREGVPRSLLEALSSGLAIVTTDAPGCRETVQPGINGYLCEPRDQRSLTAALERVLQAPERVAGMGAASRALAVARFDVQRVNDAQLAVIRDALR